MSARKVIRVFITRLGVNIVEAIPARRKIDRNERRAESLRALSTGDRGWGRVRNIVDYGTFIWGASTGRQPCLLPKRQMLDEGHGLSSRLR